MAKTLKQSLAEAMHLLSEQEEASSPAQAEELFRLSMQPLSEALESFADVIDGNIGFWDGELGYISELIDIMRAIANSVESDDDLVIPTTSVSTPAVGRIVSNETPRPFPIDDIEEATN